LANSEEIRLSEKKKTKVLFQFLHNPEYLTPGSYLFIEEPNFRGFGYITQIFFDWDNKFSCPALGGKDTKNKNKKMKAKSKAREAKNKSGLLCKSGNSGDEEAK